MSLTGRILRIEKISPNDGQGLRTVVFLKGCPLRCGWCSTPESQKKAFELYYRPAKCAFCGKCVEACPQKALKKGSDRIILDGCKEDCSDCLLCARVCPTGALGVYGMEMTVEQVMKQILKDEVFYFHSGGGVTLSGGDVLLQAEFAAALLKECRDNGIHTMAELDMYGDFSKVEMLLPYLNGLYIDIKHMDPLEHQRWTGVDNKTILENINKTAAYFKARHLKKAVHFRIPLIWDVNDSEENIIRTAQFCAETGVCEELEFLPYHRLGESTYEYLGRAYAFAGKPKMTFEDACEKARVLRGRKLPFPVKISGKEMIKACV